MANPRCVWHSILAGLALAACAGTALGATSLPHGPSELLLIGDSVTAGIYFLSIDETSMRQAWSGQLVRRLGIDPPTAPYDFSYPINHLGLAQLGFTVGGLAYLWEARRAFERGGPRYTEEDERVVLAIPGQTLYEMLHQSSRTGKYNKGSTGWTFANLFLPTGLTAIETVEHWSKRPAWVVLFIGSNDLLASFGVVGKAESPSPDEFESHYDALAGRLRACMPPDSPPDQFIVLTLPDVTRLPFLQPLPDGADNGKGALYPPGTMTSAFLVPFREHYEDDEVWTPDELAEVRRLSQAYNVAIRRVAQTHGFSVVAIDSLMTTLHEDPLFASPYSPYFSPDLHHPSFRTHALVADAVANRMTALTGDTVPPLDSMDTPLPHSGDFSGKYHTRVAAMMHLGMLGLSTGPLPPSPTYRIGLEAGGQAGHQRIGDGVVCLLAGLELSPCPVGAHTVMRLGASLRVAALALDASEEQVDMFPQRSLEFRLGAGFEPLAAWTWMRVGAGALLTLDGRWDGGAYARCEWHKLYAETAGRGWWFDRIEVGVRFGAQPGRPGRNGN